MVPPSVQIGSGRVGTETHLVFLFRGNFKNCCPDVSSFKPSPKSDKHTGHLGFEYHQGQSRQESKDRFRFYLGDLLLLKLELFRVSLQRFTQVSCFIFTFSPCTVLKDPVDSQTFLIEDLNTSYLGCVDIRSEDSDR